MATCRSERHDVTNSVVFAIIVDDFAVKFKDIASADHLINCLELHYKLTIKKYRQGIEANCSTSIARSPTVYQPPRFGKEVQTPAPPDTSPLLTFEEHHRLQQIDGVLLYYCLAVNSTGLPAVTAIESALSHATQLT